MSTNLYTQAGKAAKVGRHPTSAINDNTDGRTLIDENLKYARRQPVLFQPHIPAVHPVYRPGSDPDFIPAAVVGDIALTPSGLTVCNGRVFKAIQPTARISLCEQFVQRPQLNTAINPADEFILEESYVPASVDKRIFTADRACIVKSIEMTVTASGTDGSAVTLMIKKVPSGTAIASGSDCLASTFDLKGTANTKQSGSLHGTPANYTLAVGDALALDFTGTLTDAAGQVTVVVKEILASTSTPFGVNPNIEIVGTNVVDSCCILDASGGIKLTTTGASADQVILTPHVDVQQSAWNTIGWNTAKQFLFEARLTIGEAITLQTVWAGVRLTNPAPFDITTDADQLIVWYDAAVEGYLHYSLSVAGIDYTGVLYDYSGTAISIVAATDYVIELGVDADRYPYVIVNGILCLHDTAHAMTSLATLIPTIGIETNTTAAKELYVRNSSMSQDF